MSAVFLPRVKTTEKVTGSRDQPPRGLGGTPCKRRRNWPYTWIGGRGGERQGPAGDGAGALERKEEKRRKEEKKAWAMGNPQVMRIWEANEDPQQ